MKEECTSCNQPITGSIELHNEKLCEDCWNWAVKIEWEKKHKESGEMSCGNARGESLGRTRV